MYSFVIKFVIIPFPVAWQSPYSRTEAQDFSVGKVYLHSKRNFLGKSLEKTIQKHVSYVSYHEYLRLWYYRVLMHPPPLKNATLRANEMIKLSKKNIVIGGERGGAVRN